MDNGRNHRIIFCVRLRLIHAHTHGGEDALAGNEFVLRILSEARDDFSRRSSSHGLSVGAGSVQTTQRYKIGKLAHAGGDVDDAAIRVVSTDHKSLGGLDGEVENKSNGDFGD